MPTSLAQCCDCHTSVLHSSTFCEHRTHFFSSSSSWSSSESDHPARSRRCPHFSSTILPFIFIFIIILFSSSSTSVRAFPSRQSQQQRHHPFGISPFFPPAESGEKDAQEELVVTVVDEPLELAEAEEDDDEGRRRDDSEEEAEEKRKTAKNARRDVAGVGGTNIEVGGANAGVGVADSGVGGASADTTPKAMASSHAELFRRMRSICSRVHTRKRAPKPGSPESLVAFLCHNTNVY